MDDGAPCTGGQNLFVAQIGEAGEPSFPHCMVWKKGEQEWNLSQYCPLHRRIPSPNISVLLRDAVLRTAD